jgi:hypothetical protein
MRPVLALLLVALAAGCAPAVDLRVPAYDGPRIEGGRLLVVRGGPVVATDEALAAGRFVDASSFESATWEAVLQALSAAFTFSDVQSTTLPPDVALAPVFVSRQVVTDGQPENRWARQTYYLPTPSISSVPAEYVLVLDTLRVDRRLSTETGGVRPPPPGAARVVGRVALAVLLGVYEAPRFGRGLHANVPYALYRVGTEAPLMVGELTGFGVGPDGVGGDSAWLRSVQLMTWSLERTGALPTRGR